MTIPGRGSNFPRPASGPAARPPPSPMTRRTATACSAVLLTLVLPAAALAAEAEGDHGGEISVIPEWQTAFIPALFTLIVFSALVAILGKYAWGPIAKGLEERENKIRRDIEEAEHQRAEAEAKQREYAAQLAGAEAKVRELMAKAQKDAEGLSQRIKMDAQGEAESIRDRATRDIETARTNAVGDVRREAAELATLVAEKILRREITAEDRQQMLDESLTQIDRLGESRRGKTQTAAATNGQA